jgi:RNA polymerase sigma factor (sigma-70 family)
VISPSAARFEEIVRDLEVPLGRFVAQMISDAAVAEDVLQETFLLAWRDRARMPVSADERRAWMYGVARHQALNALRKGRRGRRAVDAMVAQEVTRPVVEQESDALATRDLLIAVLAPKDRSLFVLRYVHGFSAQSLAEMSGMRPAAVRKRLERSARALRDALASSSSQQEVPDGSTTVSA